MRTGGAIVLLFVAWMIMGLWSFATTRTKSPDAIQTAAFVVFYPVALVMYFQFRPTSNPVIWFPLIMLGVPWLTSGIHLRKVTADPNATKIGEFVGLPLKFWGIGLLLCIGCGLMIAHIQGR